jgi:hypothetical protein
MRKKLHSHLTFANVVSLIALSVALGGTTYAATGGNFILGRPNSASSTTSLSAPIAGRALQATNTHTGTGATALGLNVASGHPPFTVNSGTKVVNLNADKLDGLDSGAFVRRLWAVVKDDGTLVRGQGAVSAVTGGGGYFIRFNRDVSQCAYTATVGQKDTAYFDPGEIQATQTTGAGDPTHDVYVAISESDTGAVQKGFSLVVTC